MCARKESVVGLLGVRRALCAQSALHYRIVIFVANSRRVSRGLLGGLFYIFSALDHTDVCVCVCVCVYIASTQSVFMFCQVVANQRKS